MILALLLTKFKNIGVMESAELPAVSGLIADTFASATVRQDGSKFENAVLAGVGSIVRAYDVSSTLRIDLVCRLRNTL